MNNARLLALWFCASVILVGQFTSTLVAQQPSTNAQGSVPPPRAVVVHVVAKTTYGSGKYGGSCKAVRVTAGESIDGRARVGFFETQVGATGNQWRSAGWMAAVTASTLSDFDPRTTRVSIEYEGAVDGPSAGAVLTVGVLAAARGDTVRPDAAMTGTINPDGSIGPVAGISHKIDGAADQGMKLLLIPAGKRFDVDANTNERVDLLEYGQQKGVEVRNVFDIYEAYRLLTGSELPRPSPASTPRVRLAVQKKLKQTITAWLERFKHAHNAYDQLSGDAKYSEEVESMYSSGVEAIKQANTLIGEGEFSAAMWDCVMGSAYSYFAMELARCRYTYANLGYDGLLARLRDNDWLVKDLQEVSRRMQRETPRTLDQLSVYLMACDAYLEAISLRILAQASLDNMPKTDSEEALELASDAAANQILAWLDLKLVNDYLDLQDAYQGDPIPRNAPWRDASDYLRHAAQANLAVFDSLVVEPKAKAQSVTPDQLRDLMLVKDKTYGIVRIADEAVMPNLSNYFGDGDALGYAYLATSIYTHTRAAGLLAKHYSLGAQLDEYNQVVSLAHERTLGEWLTYAEDQTRRNIAMLQESGVDATACAQMHAVARIKARRDLEQKLEGLVEFWSADLHSRVLRRLSGMRSEAPPPVPSDPSPDTEPNAAKNES